MKVCLFAALLLNTLTAWGAPLTDAIPAGRTPSGICNISTISSSGKKFHGTGSLVGSRIITAAHVVVGDRKVISIKCSGGIEVPKEQVEYQRTVYGGNSDIGALELNQSYETDIRLPEDQAEHARLMGKNDKLQMYGYGSRQNPAGELKASEAPRKIQVKDDFIVGTDSKRMIVPGDSGGPLLKRVGKKWVLMGVNAKYVDKKGVSKFVNVAKIQGWIENSTYPGCVNRALKPLK